MSARLDYEALLAGLPDAVVGVDEGLRIVLWNPAAEALLGRSARRVLGRTLKDVFPPGTPLVRHLPDPLPPRRRGRGRRRRDPGHHAPAPARGRGAPRRHAGGGGADGGGARPRDPEPALCPPGRRAAPAGGARRR